MEAINDWFANVWNNITGLGDIIAENVGSLLMFVAVIAALFAIAVISENLICKKNGINKKSERFRLNRMTLVAIMSAIAIILNMYGFPLPLIPGFYKLDFSDIPAVIGGFAMGPVAGVMIEFIKTLLNLVLNSTATAFVGEAALFIFGCTFVLPSSIIYFANKTKKSAMKGLAAGVVLSLVLAAVLNAFLLIPTYAKVFFHSETIDPVIAAGTGENSAIGSLFTFVMFAVIPFNLVKYGVSMLITMFIYKPISYLIKKKAD